MTLTQALRVATIIVRGLAAKGKQYQLSRLFMDSDLRIVAVQETKAESEETTDRMLQPFVAHYVAERWRDARCSFGGPLDVPSRVLYLTSVVALFVVTLNFGTVNGV